AESARIYPSERWVEGNSDGCELPAAGRIGVSDSGERETMRVLFFLSDGSQLFASPRIARDREWGGPDLPETGNGFTAEREKEHQERGSEEESGGETGALGQQGRLVAAEGGGRVCSSWKVSPGPEVSADRAEEEGQAPEGPANGFSWCMDLRGFGGHGATPFA